MKSLKAAIYKAEQLASACHRKQTFYVVLSVDERDIQGNDYHVANELELENEYNGCKILHAA